MQFRITTLLFVMTTLALPLTLSAPAGPIWQGVSVAFALVAWGSVVFTAWASDWPPEVPIFVHICALTMGIRGSLSGALGVCLCIGLGLSKMFA